MRLPLFLPFRKKPGPVRWLLGLLGESWVSTPWRRLIQGLFLAAFVLLLFWVCRPDAAGGAAEAFAARERGFEAEAFLMADPLVGASAAVADRAFVTALLWSGAVLIVGLLLPRWFCGYACPLGTLIDLFDWSFGQWFRRLHLRTGGWWVNLRYLILAAVCASAAAGTILTGYVAAIPVATRGLATIVGPIQTGFVRGWEFARPLTGAHYAAAGVLAVALLLGVLGPRFWCRCLCPTGAILSLASLLRLTDRKVDSSCIQCGRCAKACSFGAVRDDFGNRPTACTFCGTCGGVCPTGAISFAGRWETVEAATPDETPPAAGITRRGFLRGAACIAIGAAGGWPLGRALGAPAGLIRPPGSVPEADFLRLCVRCGECLNACPTGILQSAGLSTGPVNLWTPRAEPEIAVCDPECNLCGQVCPTRAVRPLPLAVKRKTPMGLAVVDENTCLSHTQEQNCGKCIAECHRVGYKAIEIRLLPTVD